MVTFRVMLPAAALSALLFFGPSAATAAGEQSPSGEQSPAAAGVLRIEGAVPTPLTLTAAELAKLPRSSASITGDNKVTTNYTGVLLYDLLVKAGWQFGHGMTGKPMASYILATGKDGYQVVFTPAEVDPLFGGEKILIVDSADGGPLPAKEQPFRVLVPGDKMHARSLYSLVKLEVVRLRP